MSVDGRLPHRAFVISKGYSGRWDIRAEGIFGQMGYSGRWDIQADGIFGQKGYSGRWDIQADGIFRETMGRETRIELMTDHRAQNIA
jgi:hypothetical protein